MRKVLTFLIARRVRNPRALIVFGFFSSFAMKNAVRLLTFCSSVVHQPCIQLSDKQQTINIQSKLNIFLVLAQLQYFS